MPICKKCKRFTADAMQKHFKKQCLYCEEEADPNTLEAYSG
jgi:hypothetical protein